MKEIPKPTLREFLKGKLSESGVYESNGVKYLENKKTKSISEKLCYAIVLFAGALFKDVLNSFQIHVIIKLFLMMGLAYIVYKLCEILHWVYAKYEKCEE